MKITIKRSSPLALLLAFTSRATWTVLGILGGITLILVALVVVWGLVYMFLKCKKAVHAIGERRSNDVAQTELIILHDNWDVGPPNAQGVVTMEIPEHPGFANWQIVRSTNLVNWEVMEERDTDRLSAEILAEDLFEAEMEFNGTPLPMLFYGAQEDWGL